MIEGQEDVTWPQWHALAAACEAAGIPALFRSDHYLSVSGQDHKGALDAWGTVCGLAAVTSTLRLGTLVSPATFRHPALLAKLAVTADHISGGRVEVGMGAGWHEAEHRAFGFPFAPTRARMDVFAEQIEIVHGLWSEAPFAFAGEHYALAEVDARPRPVQAPHPPLIVGGSAGPRSAAIAARWADEYNTVSATPAQCRERRARVAEAWAAAGREPGALRFSLMTGCLVGRDEAELHERARALAALRGEAREPAELLAELAPAWVVGTPGQALERLRELADAGVERVMLQLLLHEDLDQIALIGRELAPAAASL